MTLAFRRHRDIGKQGAKRGQEATKENRQPKGQVFRSSTAPADQDPGTDRRGQEGRGIDATMKGTYLPRGRYRDLAKFAPAIKKGLCRENTTPLAYLSFVLIRWGR